MGFTTVDSDTTQTTVRKGKRTKITVDYLAREERGERERHDSRRDNTLRPDVFDQADTTDAVTSRRLDLTEEHTAPVPPPDAPSGYGPGTAQILAAALVGFDSVADLGTPGGLCGAYRFLAPQARRMQRKGYSNSQVQRALRLVVARGRYLTAQA